MRYFTVTLQVAIDDYSVEPDPSLSALDPICMVLAEHLPEITMLEMCEHENVLVSKDVWDAVQDSDDRFEDGLFINDTEELELDYTPRYWKKNEPVQVTKVQASMTPEQVADFHEDWLASQGEQIKDAELEQQFRDSK